VPAAAAAAGALVLLSPLNALLSRPASDWQLRHLGASAPRSTEAVVFDIDDASLAALKPRLGAWPFKRDVYALAVEQLRDLGASAIAIDLLLADAHPGDEALARAIARPGAPVLLAAAGLRHASDQGLPTPSPAVAPAVAPPGGRGAAAHAYLWPSLALPTPSVWPAPDRAPALGVITAPLDADGRLRRLPLWHADSGVRLPVMPLAVLRALGHEPAAAELPLDAQGALHLAFAPPAAWPEQRPFTQLAAVALGKQDAGTLRDAVRGRVVFIGSSALLADSVMTVQGQASGTAALAQVYTALRRGTWARPPSLALDASLVLLALLPALVTAWRGRPSAPRDAALALGALVVGVGAAMLALEQARQPAQGAAALVALLAGLGGALLTQQRQQAAAQRRLEHELAVAAEAARAKSAFLANVSHEIRTPLNALLGVAELLQATPLDAQQRRHVQVFHDAGRALHDLINDLLDLSKIEAGRFELDPTPFSLHALIEHVAALLRPRAEGKGLELVLQVPHDLPDGVCGDRKRLEQALINLLGNAVKFTPRGHVQLAARRDPSREHGVVFEVIDTGIGIAPSKLELIFEPFAQADGSVTRMYGGTGLGLAITRSVAELMGGSIEVRSTPGAGSTFSLRVPLPPAELPRAGDAAPESAGAGALPGRPLAVLLAEDNDVNVYIFRAMLEGQNVELTVASNGPAALELMRQRRYDLAFVDVQMPGMDGLAVTRELRRFEAAQRRLRTPVVALTANAYAADVQASLDAGCDRHVAKPFSRGQLLDALGQLGQAARPGDSASQAAPHVQAAEAGAAAKVLDRDRALARMGGDLDLYRRVAEHAAVFLGEWPQSFERASVDGNLERTQHLVHDLKSVAAALGAQRLFEEATVLEQSLRGIDARAAGDPAALARVRATIVPVLAAASQDAAVR
jgi:signal transduction histidine kinase/DNA-binding response OmpR family regulator